MEKFDKLISDDRYKSLSPVDQYDVRRRFFHKVAGDERFSQLPVDDQRDIGQRILFKGTENEAPGFFEGVKRAFVSGVEATGQHLLNTYESLDPTRAGSMLQAGVGPLLAGMAVTPPAIGGEFAGEFARKSAEQLGASPEVQAGIGTIANIAVPGGFVPEGVRGARSRAGGPLTTENIKPGAYEASPAGIRARAEAIERQLLETKRREAGMQLEQDVAASDIEGQAYIEGLRPKPGVRPSAEPRPAEMRPQDDAMAIMRGEQPPAVDPLQARLAALEAENARLLQQKRAGAAVEPQPIVEPPTSLEEAPRPEMQASSTVSPQAESVIPEIPSLPQRGNLPPETPAVDPMTARIAALEAEQAQLKEQAGIKAPEPKAQRQPRARLEDNEVAISTLIKRRGGINIPKDMKEEYGGWNRLHNKNAMDPGELAQEAYDLGMIERPDENALIEGLKAGKKSNRMAGDQDALVAGVEADRHVKALQDAPSGVEYQGKSYDAVVPEKGGVRLKDDPDKVLKKPSDILAIEEKIPFDIPEEKAPTFEQTAAGAQVMVPGTEGRRSIAETGLKPKRAQTEAPMDLEQPAISAREPGLPLTKAPADLRPAVRLKGDVIIPGEVGQRHDAVMAKIPESQHGNIQETGWLSPEGKFMTPDEATEYKFKNASNAELIKTGLRSETGAVGRLDEGMQQVEADARAARKELYERLYNYAREKGVSLADAARDHNFLQRDLARLEAEANQEKWQPSETQRPFTPLEKELKTSSENPRIFDPVPDEFKGTRLNTPTIKAITEAALETYKANGRVIDPNIPITIQVVRDLAEGNIELTGPLANYAKELGDGMLSTNSNAGKALQQASALQQALKQRGIDLGEFTHDPPPSGWEYSKEMSLRWLNIWRGALVTQLGTAVRNLESQGVRVGIDAIEKTTDGALHDMWHLAKGERPGGELSRGFGQAIDGLVDLAKRGRRQQAENILSLFPTQEKRMFYQYAGDVNAAMREPNPLPGGIAGKIASPFEKMTQAAEKGIEFANIFNRGQEFLVRKAAFRSKLADLLEKSGQNIDSIDPRAINEKMITDSVDHALEMTFATTPQKGPGKVLLDAYRAIPPLYLIAPFPKFMFNSWKFFTDYSPAGFLKLLSSKERAAIADGNYKTLSRAIIGTGMLGAAYGLRNSEYAGEKWYEINVGDKTFDTRPYNPFASYLFVADVANKMRLGTLDKLGWKEMTQGLLSANFRAGTGLFMLDKVLDAAGGTVSNEGAPKGAVNDLKRAAGETAAGFLTPFQTFKDILSDDRLLGLIGQQDFAKEEGKLRDVRSDPFLGPIMSKIPGVSQKLPQTQFPLGGEAEKEEPGLRQVTGLLLRTKTDVQKEADRLGLAQNDIVSSTGITELDRKTNEIMRPIAEKTLNALMSSRAYSQADDLQKKIWFQKWSHNIGNAARKEALNQNRDLRIEYVIKKAGKDQGRQLREIYERRGLIAPQ